MNFTTDSSVTNVVWVHQQLIQAFPGALVTVTDTRKDDQHLSVHIITALFKDVSLIQRHRQVYSALQGETGYRVHALSLCTQTPEEAS
ncbi:BolA/IbaG family iron-sulfur metabolism protein [Holospora curviuscula]|uniref:Transcriptional regulator BolA n=1 Tax=Holospora curviuscula TaxID=1082868 RepID=A0A2S5R6S1_9PROT|nr:BolA family protein [Holospora curviuscula]PPE03000.1 transcriptional regulator BolA [Holospora curviuscula]